MHIGVRQTPAPRARLVERGMQRQAPPAPRCGYSRSRLAAGLACQIASTRPSPHHASCHARRSRHPITAPHAAPLPPTGQPAPLSLRPTEPTTCLDLRGCSASIDKAIAHLPRAREASARWRSCPVFPRHPGFRKRDWYGFQTCFEVCADYPTPSLEQPPAWNNTGGWQSAACRHGACGRLQALFRVRERLMACAAPQSHLPALLPSDVCKALGVVRTV